MSDAARMAVLTEAIGQAVSDAAPGGNGVIVAGIPDLPVIELLAALGGKAAVRTTVVGAPDDSELLAWARGEGWTDEDFGTTSSHAVAGRNADVGGRLRLVLMWREEVLVHSLNRRGYRVVGPREVKRQICRLGVANAKNTSQENLWRVLASDAVSPYLAYDALAEYYVGVVNQSEPDPDDAPRELLPVLGLLRDPQLLAGRFASVPAITERLRLNEATVDRLQRAEEDDRRHAVDVVRKATPVEQERWRTLYNAFQGVARNEPGALEKFTLADALLLLSGRYEPPPPPPVPIDPDPNPEPEPIPDPVPPPAPPPPRYRSFGSLAEAVVTLTIEGDTETVRALVDQARNTLQKDEIEDSRILEGQVAVDFEPDERAVALCRALVDDKRFGGLVQSDERPVDLVLNDLGRHIDTAVPFGEVRLTTLLTLLDRAAPLVTDFEGRTLLEEYVARRAAVLPELDLLATSPLSCLVADETARRTVKELIAAYERLLDHLEERYGALRRRSAEGTVRIYNEVIALDLIRVEGVDEGAALLSPVSPLVLWKYLELADLVVTRGANLSESDRELLTGEVADIPEPLLAIYSPSDRLGEGAELGYSGRIGSLPVYRPISTEATDLTERSIRISVEKLTALYPAARQHLRVMLVDPITTRPVSKALRYLRRHKRFERATLVVARLQRKSGASAATGDVVLDELSAEHQLSVEERAFQIADALTDYLAQHPVHILAITGERRRNVEQIESEATRLHPLSVPHQLHADPIEETVTLVPRSVQPADEAPRHPFGVYHRLVSEVVGNPRTELSVRQTRALPADVCRALAPYCQILLLTGDLPDKRLQTELLRLSHGLDVPGDTAFTLHRDRILHGIDDLLRAEGMNYNPTPEGLRNLLARIQEVGGQGIFETISDAGERGFFQPALRGQLGVAVALSWYATQAVGDRHLVLSLDSYLARRWLQKREDGKRNDLLGFRETAEGEVVIDVIEVKSYRPSDPTHSSEQVREVGKVIDAMMRNQGDILVDRRRELLRLQIFREGLLTRPSVDPAWVETLNKILDGDLPVMVRLQVVELEFEENIPRLEYEEPAPTDAIGPVAKLPVRRLRLGERDIRPYLVGLGVPPASSREASVPDSAVENDEPPEEPPSSGGPTAGTDGPDPSPTSGQPAAGERQTDEPEEGLGLDPNAEERATIATTARRIYRVLQEIGVRPASEVDPQVADVGPSVIRYKVRLRPGERVSSLQNRARDLMRELEADKEPLVDNVPGTQFVGIDLPRPVRRAVRLRPFLQRHPDARSEAGLWCPIGVRPNGDVEWIDLTILPHMLVAGSTGSGKTMFLYALTVSLTRHYAPTEMQLVLIDPKQTDFVFFNRLPHLRSGQVITEADEAIEMLMQLLSVELDDRTATLTSAMARDIRGYNQRHPMTPIPPIVVVIDEFADLADVMTKQQREAFDLAMRRLAQRARNVGIHLVLATQRPTTDIVNGTLKSNLPCRISFRLASNTDSRTILDRGGAENLLGDGDMLVSTGGDLIRLQGFFLSEDDLVALLGLESNSF